MLLMRRHLPALRFLLLAGSAAGLPASALEINVENARLPGAPLSALGIEAIIAPFRSMADCAMTRTSLADAVLRCYQESGWPVTDVEVTSPGPDQLEVSVTEGRYGQIAVEGGSGWMRQAVASAWRHQPGAALTMKNVAEGLAWTHRNPLHAVSAAFSPGSETATADMTLALQSAAPLRVFSTWRNDGIALLGENRYGLGVEAADLLGLPLWISAEALTSNDPEAFQGARSGLRWFLPWRHELRLSGQWMQGEADVPLPGFRASSFVRTWSATSRYLVPLPVVHDWQTDVGAGIDFLHTTSGVAVEDFRAAASADAWHLTLEANAQRSSGPQRTSLHGELIWSPGGLSGAGEAAAHGALRTGASADYFLARISAMHLYEWETGWSLAGRLSSQWASEPVLPVQLFSAAGTYGVRGFSETGALGDTGLETNLELNTPALHPDKSFFSLQPLAFLDAGWVSNEATGDDIAIASAGIGLKLRWGTHAMLSCDYGWRLTEPGGRAHFALRMEF